MELRSKTLEPIKESAMKAAKEKESPKSNMPIPAPLVGIGESKKGMTPERRAFVLANMRKAIPGFAAQYKARVVKNCTYARLCILDAFQGRLSNGLATNSKKSTLIYTIFCIQTSELLFKCVLSACALHTLAIFIEPENACSNFFFMKVFQMAVICIYLFDIGLKMSYEGLEVRIYWKSMMYFCDEMVLTSPIFLVFFRNIFIMIGNSFTSLSQPFKSWIYFAMDVPFIRTHFVL